VIFQKGEDLKLQLKYTKFQ